MSSPIYLDNAATTPLLPEARAAMLPYLDALFHNPSALYPPAASLRELLDACRQELATLVACPEARVVFAASGTEANHMAVLCRAPISGAIVLASGLEHSSLSRLLASRADSHGWHVHTLTPDSAGTTSVPELVSKLHELQPDLVVHTAANHETGVWQPWRQIGEACTAAGVPLHVDAVAAWGKAALTLGPTATMAMASHKIHGPKGAAALIAGPDVHLRPWLYGGKQEHGLRAGTENVPAIAGLAAACRWLREHGPAAAEVARAALTSIVTHCLAALPGAQLHGAPSPRTGFVAMLGIPGVDGRLLCQLLAREGVLASTGSACTSHTGEPSRTLLAMGVAEALVRGSIRLSVGWLSGAETAAAGEIVSSTARRLQRMSGR